MLYLHVPMLMVTSEAGTVRPHSRPGSGIAPTLLGLTSRNLLKLVRLAFTQHSASAIARSKPYDVYHC